MRKFIAIIAAKQVSFWTRIFGRGGGGALPGLIAERIYPRIISKQSLKLRKGVIFVTGTNGKTTTSKMIAEILEKSGYRVLNNSGGSNLSRGLASALIDKTHFFTGRVKKDIGVFEIDEATMPKAVKHIKPMVIVVTNIFRDQLDRYGEVDKTVAIIKKAIKLSPDSTIVLNADDPLVSTLGEERKKVIYYGIDDGNIEAISEMAIDSKDCPLCGYELTYEKRYYGHIGIYNCKKCSFSHPRVDISGKDIKLLKKESFANIIINGRENKLRLPLTGLYNIYNALSAIGAARALKIKEDIIFHTLTDIVPVFGRMEKFEINGKEAIIHLVKNPIGLNQVLETITKDNSPKTLLMLLNDNFADGTDISWIWDGEIELIKNQFEDIVLSGTRAEDLNLRLKYAGIQNDKIKVIKNIDEGLNEAISKESNTLYILPTYTAMLSLRNSLVKRGLLKDYWQT